MISLLRTFLVSHGKGVYQHQGTFEDNTAEKLVASNSVAAQPKDSVFLRSSCIPYVGVQWLRNQSPVAGTALLKSGDEWRDSGQWRSWHRLDNGSHFQPLAWRADKAFDTIRIDPRLLPFMRV